MKQNQLLILAALGAAAYWWFKIRKPAGTVTSLPVSSSTMVAGQPYGFYGLPAGMGRRR